ncbi:hypothetical protein [Lentzea albida]|uniref:Uncharacterized protein n=1 Tax=Lentzea albida TaxID=65499 RepID=A0A1H9AW40_9PSEU|nr:hypothetical protein [Lentzea albida]SEP81032.1 hypothetical protein SAMN04488000_101314 [Lentzea albida]
MPINEFGPDGTQAPPPPRLFPDPLAGLVTADGFVAPQWTSVSSRVVVPTPPAPSEEMRQAIYAQMQQEQRRRPRGRAPRAPHQYAPQEFAPAYQAFQQMPVPQQQQQQQQPAQQTSGVAAFIGCLIVIGFFVLVLLGVLGAIFS